MQPTTSNQWYGNQSAAALACGLPGLLRADTWLQHHQFPSTLLVHSKGLKYVILSTYQLSISFIGTNQSRPDIRKLAT